MHSRFKLSGLWTFESLAVTDAYSTAEALPPSLYLFYHYIMLGRSDLVPLSSGGVIGEMVIGFSFTVK